MDVDHFKQYNDLYGHPGGDVCLRAVARAISGFARPADLAARYGGEEFALLLLDTDAAGCRLVAEELLETLRALKIPHARNLPSRHVTLSAGSASAYPTDVAEDCLSLLREADRALYRAKGEGRDRLVTSAGIDETIASERKTRRG